MKKIPWKDTYLTGVEEIDRQHKDFLKLINRLTIIHDYADHNEFAQRLLLEIGKYADYHFTSEENIMYLTGYPDIVRQHTQHLKLMEDFTSRVKSLQGKQTGIEELLDFLGTWFAQHTVEEDRKIGSHINSMKK